MPLVPAYKAAAKVYRALHAPQRTAQDYPISSFNSPQFHSDPPLPQDCRQSPNR
jgi:hypothetical protein